MNSEDLPPFCPKSMARLRQLMTRYSSSMREIVDTFHECPGMTVWALSEANSPLLGFQGLIRTVPQALVLIGFVNLRNFSCQRKQFQAVSMQRYTRTFRSVSKIARRAVPWFRLIAPPLKEHADAVIAIFDSILAAIAASFPDPHRSSEITLDTIHSQPPEFFQTVHTLLDSWGLPESISRFAETYPQLQSSDYENQSSDAPPPAPLVHGFLFDTVLRLVHLDFPTRDNLQTVFEASPVWRVLPEATRVAIQQLAAEHTMTTLR